MGYSENFSVCSETTKKPFKDASKDVKWQVRYLVYS